MSHLDKVSELLELNDRLAEETRNLLRSVSHKDVALRKVRDIVSRTHQGQERCFSALSKIDSAVQEGLRE